MHSNTLPCSSVVREFISSFYHPHRHMTIEHSQSTTLGEDLIYLNLQIDAIL